MLVQALKDIGDFDLELKWDFQSWGRSICIYLCMRLDTSHTALRTSFDNYFLNRLSIIYHECLKIF